MKLAVAGLGFMGRTHLAAVRNIPSAELVAVATRDPAKRREFSGVRTCPDWRDLVHDPEVEAVDICLPTDLHAMATVAALEAGKHVLVEKPMALDEHETQRMLRAADGAGSILMVAHALRFFPEYEPLLRIVRDAELGPLRAAVFRRRCAAPGWGDWFGDPARSGGGVLDLLIHDVDLALHLFGVPEAVSADGYVNLSQGLDLITGTLHYADGAAVTIAGGWHHFGGYPFSMEYTVSFEDGTVEYSSAGRPPTLHRAGVEPESLVPPQRDGYQTEIEYFLECVAAARRPERCPPEESAAAVRLTRLLEQARQRKGEPIPCSL